MTRVIAGFKVLSLERGAAVAWPWGIVAISLAVSLGIWSFLGDEARASSQTFGIAALLIVWLIIYVQAVGDLFPFAVGYGLTRHHFALALGVHAGIHAVLYGTVLALLARLEDGTGGWNVGLEFFRPAGLATGNVLTDALAWTVVLVGLAALAVLGAAIHGRWGTKGIYVSGAASIAIGGAIAIAITAFEWWGTVGDWLQDQSAFALLAVWPLPVLAAMAAGSYVAMRRMVP
jgi:hypothetical protein